MPYYQFTVTAGSSSALRKQEIAEAITKAHCSVTGAPEHYVNCSFTEVPEDGIWQAGKKLPGARMIGVIRKRDESIKRALLLALGHAWADATGEPFDSAVMALIEVPGYQALENGALLGEAADDHLMKL
ncbi:phenylpyruvate tautomerase PptA (4-oxalocrotonate tautomerase family) [Rhodococcus erythropolis]|uniref:tautomerase family protein n=1 Tax=Rhodococcus erythropolis TaxID=1833 RepID=UPI0021678556|nr:tautomerase family protein [Rhodococcus erythropolis]MCS4255695.1 phenylpyruvate tautomerase PptA (4-oxalocrotonate tautomerase family) [Rhodococcus erythropolis]MCW2425208.1 phenylpyruvate tautomerase PptA (4-oxalocrotonate tautomerase family) [Rhodococcus erythropolis]